MIDVGCGSGQLIKWVKHTRPQVQCHGVDFSQEALNKVDIKDVDLKLANAQELPYPDDQFDLVICTHLLDRIPEPDTQKAIAELKRVGVGYVWILVSDCDGTEEDKYLKNTPYKDFSLLTTRRSVHWWEKNFQREKLNIIQRLQNGKKLSFLCHAREGILGHTQKRFDTGQNHPSNA